MTLQTEITLNNRFSLEAFRVVRADVEAFCSLHKMIEVWKQTIDSRLEYVKSRKEQDQFNSCRAILQTIAFGLNPECARHYQTFICVSDRTLLGIMQIRIGRDLIIHTLVTNPSNICSALNPNQVRGVGTCLLLKAEEVARELGKQNLRLTSFRSAETFYKNRGFSADEDSLDMVKKVSKVAQEILPFEEAA